MNEKQNLNIGIIGAGSGSFDVAIAKAAKENKHIIYQPGVGSGKTILRNEIFEKQSKAEPAPLILPDQRILDMRGNPITKKGPTPSEIRAKKQHDIAEAKIQELVLEYFRVSKDDKPGSGTYFNKFNNQWKVFATIKNKQQRDVTLHLNAFEKNVENFMEHAANLVRQRQEDSNNPTTEDQK